jgi:L-threonylcarbamoyladenylate synthase
MSQQPSDLLKSTTGPADDPRVVILRRSASRAVEWAAERLSNGGVIALPTDTVYGIAASLSHPDALKRLYAIKGRPENRPLPILVSSSHMVEHLVAELSHDVTLLLDRYWPGPLTVVLPARPGVPAEATGADNTVGLRMPNHPLAIEVIAKAGGALACTSANRSGAEPACDAQTVADTIGPELDLILDGGVAPGGVPSTVVSFSTGEPTVLREGAIPGEHLLATWRELLAAHDVRS